MDFIESEDEDFGRYEENLIGIITNHLKLKPNSFVSIEVTLNKRGDVLKVVHKCSSDDLSKDYILENVSKINFPHFFGEIANQSEYTFPLTLKVPL